MPLVDVLRAAISEIEQYERVVLNVQPGIVVVGQAVNDVVHLVAEIVENATTFSPEDTQVYVSGQPLSSGGVLLDITDNGVGISDQEMSHANWRLDNPPVVDVAVSRRMGLFVVGRLAARHGVRVRLRHAQAGGLTALIWLPDTVAAAEVAAPLGRLRRFEPDDFGPAPSLSAPTQSASPAMPTQAAARIPRFSPAKPSAPGSGSVPAQPGATPASPNPASPGPVLPARAAGATPSDSGTTGSPSIPSFGGSASGDTTGRAPDAAEQTGTRPNPVQQPPAAAQGFQPATQGSPQDGQEPQPGDQAEGGNPAGNNWEPAGLGWDLGQAGLMARRSRSAMAMAAPATATAATATAALSRPPMASRPRTTNRRRPRTRQPRTRQAQNTAAEDRRPEHGGRERPGRRPESPALVLRLRGAAGTAVPHRQPERPRQ